MHDRPADPGHSDRETTTNLTATEAAQDSAEQGPGNEEAADAVPMDIKQVTKNVAEPERTRAVHAVEGLQDDVRNLKFPQLGRFALAADRTNVNWQFGEKGGAKVVDGAYIADRKFDRIPLVGRYYFPGGTLSKIVWRCEKTPQNPSPKLADKAIAKFMNSIIATLGDPSSSSVDDNGDCHRRTMHWVIEGVQVEAVGFREPAGMGLTLEMLAQPHPGILF